MSTPDLTQLPGINLADDEPVFSEPWEAQAFALAVGLHEQGAFEWGEWAETLGRVIAADKHGKPYYELWLAALEELTMHKSIVSNDEIEVRAEAWKRALAATPHGEPVELENGSL